MLAKEAVILAGRSAGAAFTELANLTGFDPSTTGRRHTSARERLSYDENFATLLRRIANNYAQGLQQLQV